MVLTTLNHRLESHRRRDAFTLLEVLVVVAILVVLASIASVQVFRYLDDAKKDKAYLQAKNIEKALTSFMVKHSDTYDADNPPPLQVVVQPPDGGKPLLEGGTEAIHDPWGKPYQVQVTTSDAGDRRLAVTTTAPDGEQISSLKKR